VNRLQQAGSFCEVIDTAAYLHLMSW